MNTKNLKKGHKAVVINHPDKKENGKVVTLGYHCSAFKCKGISWIKNAKGKRIAGSSHVVVDGDLWHTDKVIRLADHLSKPYYANVIESKYLAPIKEKVAA